MFAVIRVRGSVGVKKDKKDTLQMLRLKRINHCIIISKDSDTIGMVKKVKDYVTWGEINDKNLEKLVVKRGRKMGNHRLKEEEAKRIASLILKDKSIKGKEIKPVFRLSPPSKGYRSTKLAFPKGDLGYRGEKINDLLEKMM